MALFAWNVLMMLVRPGFRHGGEQKGPITMQTLQEKADRRKEEAIARILRQPTYGAIDWRALMRQGTLVRLTIRRCGFVAKLELFDLGVTVRDERARQALARTLVLGEKRLLPESYMKELERITSAARHLLKRCTFTLSPELGAFLPVSAYATWRKEVPALRDSYFALRDEIIANYRAIVRQVIEEYEFVAKDTYGRIRETKAEILEESEAEFVANYCARIEALIPSPERIRASFDFVYTIVDGVRQIGDEEGADQAGQIENAREARLPLPAQWSQQATDWEYQRAAMTRDMLQQEQKQKKEMIDTFLSAVVSQLRSLIYQVMTDVLATLEQRQRKDGKFSPRSVVQLKNLVKQISLLNFYGDEEVDRMMAQVQRVLDLKPEERQASLREIQDRLRAIALVSRDTLLNLEEELPSAREFAIPDVPAASLVRDARMELGLNLETTAFMRQFETRPERLYSTPSLWTFDEVGIQREAQPV
jgi:hypothetical protein